MNIVDRPFIEKLLLLLLAIFPIGTMIIKGWVSGFLFACSAISIYLIFKNRDKSKVGHTKSLWSNVIVLMFLSPFLAILISQTFRQDWTVSDYDSPSRFLLAIPIFYVCFKKNFIIEKIWQYTIPVTLVITAISLQLLPKTGWAIHPERVGTFFVDPLTFGQICLSLGLLSLFTINIHEKDKWYSIGLKIIGALIGFYLSIKSGSRTGWLAVPFVFFIFLWTYGPKNRILSILVALTISFATTLGAYNFSSTVKGRVTLAINEIKSYKFNEMNEDTSVGMRISFARMGWYYFKLKPVSGWGDQGFIEHINDPEISKYASQTTRDAPYGARFHNEFTTNAVKSGIWGIIETSLLFFVPLSLFFVAWKRSLPQAGAFGLAYVICQLISSMSTEVFNLKFTASFYALFISCLMGSILSEMSKQNLSLKVPNK